MYADDLLLLSASLNGLQKMLNICSELCDVTLLNFNCRKCSLFVAGPEHKMELHNLYLCGIALTWSNSFKYLGVLFKAGTNLEIDVKIVKQKFYCAVNKLFSKLGYVDELIRLQLAERYCLPLLLYSSVPARLTKQQVNDVNIAWNSIYRKCFGFNKWESVRLFIHGLGRLDFTHLRLWQHIKLCRNAILNTNIVLHKIVLRYISASKCEIYNTSTKLCKNIFDVYNLFFNYKLYDILKIIQRHLVNRSI